MDIPKMQLKGFSLLLDISECYLVVTDINVSVYLCAACEETCALNSFNLCIGRNKRCSRYTIICYLIVNALLLSHTLISCDAC